MQVVLLNEKFESVTIYDISLLQTVTEIQCDTFPLSAIKGNPNYIRDNYNNLARLSFSFGIIQDIVIGLPKVMFNAILQLILSRTYVTENSENYLHLTIQEIESQNLLQTVKSDLSAFLLQAKKDATANQSNECRAFFTENYVREFIGKVAAVKENLLKSENIVNSQENEI